MRVENRKRCHSADIGGDWYLDTARRVVAPYGGLAAGTIQPGGWRVGTGVAGHIAPATHREA